MDICLVVIGPILALNTASTMEPFVSILRSASRLVQPCLSGLRRRPILGFCLLILLGFGIGCQDAQRVPCAKDGSVDLTTWNLLVFDKRGQGLSDPTISAPNLEERTKDIEAVMDDAGVEQAVLLGLSEGGPMCLNFAHARPERIQGLVLLGTTAKWAQSDDYPIGLPLHVMQSVPVLWGRGVLRDIFFPSMTREQLDDDTYRAFERLIAPREAIEQLVEMMIDTDVRGLLPEIDVPALVIHFSGDLSVPIRMGRFVADHLPNAEFLEVNGVDHSDISQSPEAIDRIHEFCTRVTSEPVA